MEQIIESLSGQSWWVYVVTVVTVASSIAAVTPTPKEGSTLAKVYGVIDFLALNVLKAKDKGVEDAPAKKLVTK